MTDYTIPNSPVRPENPSVEGVDFVKTANGEIVKRTTLSNGNTIDNMIFEADVPKGKVITEETYQKRQAAKVEAAKAEAEAKVAAERAALRAEIEAELRAELEAK